VIDKRGTRPEVGVEKMKNLTIVPNFRQPLRNCALSAVCVYMWCIYVANTILQVTHEVPLTELDFDLHYSYSWSSLFNSLR